MSRIYLPTSEQIDTMNEKLDSIASAIGYQMDVSTWSGVQKAVRMGIAPRVFPIGTQLEVAHSVIGNKLYDVVAHDYLKSRYDPTAHTMTLLSHDCLFGLQSDAPEAFYYASEERQAGTYSFSIATAYGQWATGTYKFTTTHALPVGGQFTINGTTSAAITTLKVRAYSSRTSTTVLEECTITSGASDTSLGTLGVTLNHPDRISFGSNNYKESAIRQYVLSSAAAGSVWSPQTGFDRPPTWAANTAGFAGGFGEEILSAIGEVMLPCVANATYEAPDSTVQANTSYVVKDRFYIPSSKEIIGTSPYAIDVSQQYQFYVGSINADRIKYRNNIAANWITRTPHQTNPGAISIFQATGVISASGVTNTNSSPVAFTIV